MSEDPAVIDAVLAYKNSTATAARILSEYGEAALQNYVSSLPYQLDKQAYYESLASTLPQPGTVGNFLVSDGTHWTSAPSPGGPESDPYFHSWLTDTSPVWGASATNATLTRSGAGTSGDPYTLGLALGTANTWSADQTAPHIIQSKHYNADDPRPSGWPGTAANALDDEFEATLGGAWSWHSGSAPSVASTAIFPGFLAINNGTVAAADYLQRAVSWAGDFDLAGCPITAMGLVADGIIGVFVVDANGTGVMAGVKQTNLNPFWQPVSGTITTWGAPTLAVSPKYEYGPEKPFRIGMKRVGSAVSYYWLDKVSRYSFVADATWASTAAHAGVYYSVPTGYSSVSLGNYLLLDWFRVATP